MTTLVVVSAWWQKVELFVAFAGAIIILHIVRQREIHIEQVEVKKLKNGGDIPGIVRADFTTVIHDDRQG